MMTAKKFRWRHPATFWCLTTLAALIGIILGLIISNILISKLGLPFVLGIMAGIAGTLLTIALHELGHWSYFRFILKKGVLVSLGDIPGSGLRLRVGRPADYADLSNPHIIGIGLSGVIAGLVPLIILAWYWLPLGLAIIPYLYPGCRHDFKLIRRRYNAL